MKRLEREVALREFCSEVALLKFRAGNLGLFKTTQALEVAVTAVGYEVAEKLQNKRRLRAVNKPASLGEVMRKERAS